MEIRHIKASELVEFAEKASSYYKDDIPITPWRVLSQANNPFAKADDVLLIVAEENKKLLGYIGILPGILANDSSERIFWNSCWWSNPASGAMVSMTLLSEFMKMTSKRVAFSDLSQRTQAIIQKLGFNVMEREGVLINLKSALHSRSAFRKKSDFKSKGLILTRKTGVFLALDMLLNLFRRTVYRKFDKNPEVRILKSENPGEEFYSFIKDHSQDAITVPTSQHIKWWFSDSWLVEENAKTKSTSEKYYFSSLAKNFTLWTLVIKLGEKIIGTAILSRKDGVLKTHFLHYSKDNKILFFKTLIRNATEEKVNKRFISFHEEFSEFLIEESKIKNRIKKLKRYTAISTIFSDNDKEFQFQDGDGDYIFT